MWKLAVLLLFIGCAGYTACNWRTPMVDRLLHAEEKQETYKTAARSRTTPQELAKTTSDKPPPTQITAIVGNAAVLTDGRILRPGDTINGLLLVQVHPHHVVIQRADGLRAKWQIADTIAPAGTAASTPGSPLGDRPRHQRTPDTQPAFTNSNSERNSVDVSTGPGRDTD